MSSTRPLIHSESSYFKRGVALPLLEMKSILVLAQFNQKLELSSTWCANSRKTLVLKLDFIYSFSKIHQIFQTFLFKVTDGEKLVFHWLLIIILNQSQIIESALTTHSSFNNTKVARMENNTWSPVIFDSFMYNSLL